MMQPLLGYLAVFVAAAIPWVELVVVIPPALAFGLNPVAVGLVAFVGNALPVAGIVMADRHVAAGWRRAQVMLDQAWAETTGREDKISRFVLPTLSVSEEPPEERGGKRAGWRSRLTSRAVHRYGVPGLALVAPITTGVHLATLVALGLSAPKSAVLSWMVASLAIWAATITLLTHLGISLIR